MSDQDAVPPSPAENLSPKDEATEATTQLTVPESQQASGGSIPIILSSTLGTEKWSFECPGNIPAQRLISRFVKMHDFNFAQHDENGERVPYRLMWQERSRFLGELETLAQVGVQPGDTIRMTVEARAGMRSN